MTKLSLKTAGAGSGGSGDPLWTLLEEHYDDEGVLEYSNVVSFGSRAEAEAELGRLDLSNLEQQRLLDGETITLWQ
jgi:hypothetical protein